MREEHLKLLDIVRLTFCMAISAMGVSYSSSTFAAEPPSCQDKKILYRMKEAYEGSLMARGVKGRFKSATLKETGVSTPPAGVNQYAPSKDHYNKSRYCETSIVLDNGETDRGYVRIDGLKDLNEKDFNFELCTLKFDTFKDECEDVKLK